VYSYSLACVECSNYTMNWIKYIAVAFLPLTLFLGVIIVFRLRVTSGLLNGFVFVTQIYSVPAQLRILTSSLHASPTDVAAGINDDNLEFDHEFTVSLSSVTPPGPMFLPLSSSMTTVTINDDEGMHSEILFWVCLNLV